mgnify:CR=1 FL=1
MAKWGGDKMTLVPYSTGSLRIFLAVPATDISMLGIKNELEEDNYSAGESFTNISLENLSDGSEYTINATNNVDDRILNGIIRGGPNIPTCIDRFNHFIGNKRTIRFSILIIIN